MRLIDADQFGVVSFQGKSDALIENEDFIKGVLFVLDKIHEAPTVERPHGEWIFVHPLQEDDDGAYMCSVCNTGDWYLCGNENFCPNCGADMREGDEK